MSQNRHITPLVQLSLTSPVLGVAQGYANGDTIPPHHHDTAQLIYAVSGVMTVETENGLWVVPPARAVWVPPEITHHITMTGTVEMRTLYFDKTALPLNRPDCCVVQVSELLRHAILRIIDFIPPYDIASPEARIVGVVYDEIVTANTAPLHLVIPKESRIHKVALMFIENPADRRPCKEWANLANVSERTLERLFYVEVGTSFGKWQQSVRLLSALRVLASGTSVTTTAFEVGFNSPSAFIAMFRRAMGSTPTQYFGNT